MKPFKIVVDTREQTPFKFPDDVEVVSGTLKTGDYSIEGLTNLVCVERKSLQDIVGCIGQHRDRFKAELHRMQGYKAKAVIIEASLRKINGGNWKGKVHPNHVLGSIASWRHRFGVHFIYADSPELASDECYRFLKGYHNWLREVVLAII